MTATGRWSRPTGSSSDPTSPSTAARRLVPYLTRSRRQPPLPLAGAPGPRRGRRTATTSSTRRRCRPTSAARPGCVALGRGRTRPRPRHRPEPHGGRRPRTRSGATKPAGEVLRPRPRDRRAPPLLRRRRARRRAGRGPGGVRGDARDDPAPRRRRASSTACASTTRTASPTRAAYLERLRAAGVEHVWVEKILETGERLRDWPVEGTTGYEFLADVQALFVDPAGRGRVHRARRRGPAVRRGRGRGQARAGRDDVRSPRCERLRRLARRPGDRRGRSPRCSVYRTLRRARDGPGRRRRSARAGGRPAGPARAAPPGTRPPGARRVRHPLPADDGRGHGQGRRGHGVLPVRPAARAQRGRRRPRAVRRCPSTTSTRPTASAPARFPRNLLAAADPRHEAQRRRARPHRRARRHAPNAGAGSSTAGTSSPRRCAARARPTGSRSCSSTRRSSARGRSATNGSRRIS